MSIVEPTDDQIKAFMNGPQDAPFVMVNLNTYRERAVYPADYDGAQGPADCPGREAYYRYGAEAFQAIPAVGGEIIFSGETMVSNFAPQGQGYDDVVLVRYPGFQNFFAMMDRPAYVAAFVHRLAGLEAAKVFPVLDQAQK